MIFQVTKEDVDVSTTPKMGRDRIGQWVFVIDGWYQGFYETQSEIEKEYRLHFKGADMVFKLTKEDIFGSSTMTKRDIGKWCFMVCGCYHGFHKTREKAEEQYMNLGSMCKINP